jgi:hypothetical protein
MFPKRMKAKGWEQKSRAYARKQSPACVCTQTKPRVRMHANKERPGLFSPALLSRQEKEA